MEYRHDPMGRRVAKLVDGEVTEKYLWMGRTTLLAVYNGDGALKSRFLYADGRTPRGMVQDGKTFYFAYDQVGSLRAVIDVTGSVVKTVRYDSFGNIIEDTNSDLTVPFGFAGGLHDRDTGLVRFGYRDYAPETGRWTAKDPIGFGGGDINLFSYVSGKSLQLTDPEGLKVRGVGEGVTSGMSPIGNGEMIGGIIGGGIGGFGGACVGGPAGGVAGGIAGGAAGGLIGEQFDDPCSGSLNCDEDKYIKTREKRENECYNIQKYGNPDPSVYYGIKLEDFHQRLHDGFESNIDWYYNYRCR